MYLKFDKKKKEAVLALVREDSYTVREICQKVGITPRTLQNHRREDSQFAEDYKKAEQERIESILAECNKSLRRLMQGYEVEEERTVFVKRGDEVIVKEKVVTKRHIPPCLPAIIHYQTNRDPDNWKNRQSMEHTGKGGQPIVVTVDNEEQKKIIEAVVNEPL